jgi:hypothetical protein
MSTAEILAEIPNLSSDDRRRVLDRLLEIEDETAAVETARRTADEGFQILDAMEAEDEANQSIGSVSTIPARKKT